MNDNLRMFDNIKWTAAFEVTRYCNMACDICGVNSGPHAPFQFLDTDRIRNILTAAAKNPSFAKAFVLSGGEVTTAYAYDSQYLGRLFQMGRDLKMRCTLRTNGKISGRNLATFVDDMVPFAALGRRAHKVLRIGLSLDASHNNAFQSNLRLVRTLVHDAGLPTRVFFIVSVGASQNHLIEFARGLELPVEYNPVGGGICKIGDIRVQGDIAVYDAGRARANHLGQIQVSGLTSALSESAGRGMVWFSVNDTAAYIHNFNTLLSTPMRDENSVDKDLARMMSELRAQCAANLGR